MTLAQLANEKELLENDTSSFVEEDDAADSGADDFDNGDASSAGSAAGYNPESPLVQQAQYVEAFVQVDSVPFKQPHSSTVQPTFDLSEVAQPADNLFANVQAETKTSLPGWQGIDNHVTFPSSMFDSAIAPPLPPRPYQKRQRIWEEPSSQDEERLGASSEMPSWTPMSGLGHEYPEHRETSFDPDFSFQPVADCMQTPPPTVPAAEALDSLAATGNAAMYKTSLCIHKVVDEQPPTPTSINSHKRSADEAFDENTEEVIEQMAAVLGTEVAAPTIEQLRSQRPIAQPKSILRRALNAAKVMIPATALGAVFTVGALTALPESFFTVA